MSSILSSFLLSFPIIWHKAKLISQGNGAVRNEESIKGSKQRIKMIRSKIKEVNRGCCVEGVIKRGDSRGWGG